MLKNCVRNSVLGGPPKWYNKLMKFGIEKNLNPPLEHLKSGIKPIIVSVSGYLDDYKDNLPIYEKIQKEGDHVHWSAEDDYFKEHNMASPWSETYVISDCNAKDKWSGNYNTCLGFAIVGKDKTIGENISLLSHLSPDIFLQKGWQEKFKNDISNSIKKLTEKSEAQTIDSLLFGGLYHDDGNYKDQYDEAIRFIGEILKQELGFEPIVATGPNFKLEKGGTIVYLDTKNRRLYLDRPYQENNLLNHPYKPSEINNKKDGWINKE